MRFVKKSYFILILLAFTLIAIVATATLVFVGSNKEKHVADIYPLDITISTRKNSYKKSEFVVLDVTTKNVSDFDVSYPTGADCPFGDPKIYTTGVDKPMNSSGFIACTLQAISPMKPGYSIERTIELDMSHFESGFHTLLGKYTFEGPNGQESAISRGVTIELTPADIIYDCSQHTSYPATICANVAVMAKDQAPELNNKTCLLIKERLGRAAPEVNPIPYLSTTSCDNGEPAAFVFNTFKNSSVSFERMVSKLAQKDGAICSSIRYSIERIESRLETRFC